MVRVEGTLKTISEIVSFLNSKGFGKREKSDRLSLSLIPFLIGFHLFYDMCVLSIVADYRIKVKLDLLFCKGWVRPLRKPLDRRYEYA